MQARWHGLVLTTRQLQRIEEMVKRALDAHSPDGGAVAQGPVKRSLKALLFTIGLAHRVTAGYTGARPSCVVLTKSEIELALELIEAGAGTRQTEGLIQAKANGLVGKLEEARSLYEH